MALAGGRIFPIDFPAAAPPSLGTRAPMLFSRTIDISTARTDELWEVAGTFVWAINSNDIADELTIKFNSQEGQGIPLRRGAAFGGVPFSRLYLTNVATVAGTLTVVFGNIDPSVLQLLNSAAASSVTSLTAATTNLLTKPTVFISSADLSIAGVTAAVVLAANAARREAILSNLTANASPFRIGDAGVAAAEGIELNPGQTLVLNTTAEIRAFNTAAGAQSITVTETRD